MEYKGCFFTGIFSFCLLLSANVFAQQGAESTSINNADTSLKTKVKTRSGYEADDIGFGGRSSVGKQLYLDDIFVPDHLRFPEFDKSLQPYYEWKRSVREKSDVQLGQDYTSR